MVKRDKIFI